LYFVADIKKKKTSLWAWHVVGIHRGRIVKEIFESKSEGRRRMGRTRLRNLEDVE